MAIQKLNEKHMALTVGAFAAIVNAAWAIIVMVGSGQMFVDWMKGVHFMTSGITVTAFSAIGAAMLIVVAFIFGAILGWLFAALWNWIATQKWAK